MGILSFEFLIFTALVVVLYYLMPLRYRWSVLLAASAVFAALSGWQSLASLSAAAVAAWAGCGLLQRMQGCSIFRRRLVLAAFLVLDFGAMIFIKYSPPAAAWLRELMAGRGLPLPVWELAIPLGLSYFTLQSAGLLVDCYWGKGDALRNPLKTWIFIGYFPQLIQGPVSSWKQLGDQLLTGHRLEPVRMVSGFQLMLWGYFKKLVIADRLAPVAPAAAAAGDAPGWLAALALGVYAIRLYADFSGGMDVVRGISRMLGVELPENFRRPFFSQSVAEYWRRWHITLGAWFRSYLMYPLTTSRFGIALGRRASVYFGKKTGRAVPTALATLLVFLLIGIWHTANWNAVLYGGYFGILMAAALLMEPIFKRMNRRWELFRRGWMKPVRMVRTWMLVAVAQVFAITSGPGQAFGFLGAVLHRWDFAGAAERMTGIMAWQEWAVAGAGLSVLLAVDILCERKIDVCDRLARAHFWIRWPVLLALIAAILIFGSYGHGFESSAFVYAQF